MRKFAKLMDHGLLGSTEEDQIPLGMLDLDGERFLFLVLGTFQKAHNFRELIFVSYSNVYEY